MLNTPQFRLCTIYVLSILAITAMCIPLSSCPSKKPGGGWHTNYLSHRYFMEGDDDFIGERPFVDVAEDPLSTFAVDVDTAGYTIIRRDIVQHQTLPTHEDVRIEEMVNYFDYDYPLPTDPEVPFSVYTEVAECPWRTENKLLHIGLKGANPAEEERPPSNIVFLIDVSGSMRDANKLPLVKDSLRLLVNSYLTSQDTLGIVKYASGVETILEPEHCTPSNKSKMLNIIDRLRAGGNTNGSGGLERAYLDALYGFIPGGINRVILCSDGDFNMGYRTLGDLESFISSWTQSDIFLIVLGFGMFSEGGDIMETLADHGNGNYSYIDTLTEAHKVLVNEMTATMLTIAKDVKVQLQFNPAEVSKYRLIGYENRQLDDDDFDDDRVDAGDIGAGHTVTALYEITMADDVIIEGEGEGGGRGSADPEGESEGEGGEAPADPEGESEGEGEAPADPEGEGEGDGVSEGEGNGKWIDVKSLKQDSVDWTDQQVCLINLRYKEPEQNVSKLIEKSVLDSDTPAELASEDFRFSASVASFGLLLRHSLYSGDADYYSVYEMARAASGEDPYEYRRKFMELVERAQRLSK